ncbi:hypothetical protein L226DRAFT_532061 [Lentinus tigrinus ALCF2SS1-7]|uniref:Uncharacterized protein n=1 Tax=Lentinus tigrinus ALCF2SS1-6 TaxID=1328759 RepID=A0A5C2S292_9APHY|nr:hypothetical protein L227DRAFT_577850 [Lentinus tigrinus ALCF2SS1-6]RPD78748.1 hypothetical protein L226DRAFT_532061 [Lentinus tigrinus ALCF2SS1-7]
MCLTQALARLLHAIDVYTYVVAVDDFSPIHTYRSIHPYLPAHLLHRNGLRFPAGTQDFGSTSFERRHHAELGEHPTREFGNEHRAIFESYLASYFGSGKWRQTTSLVRAPATCRDAHERNCSAAAQRRRTYRYGIWKGPPGRLAARSLEGGCFVALIEGR